MAKINRKTIEALNIPGMPSMDALVKLLREMGHEVADAEEGVVARPGMSLLLNGHEVVIVATKKMWSENQRLAIDQYPGQIWPVPITRSDGRVTSSTLGVLTTPAGKRIIAFEDV